MVMKIWSEFRRHVLPWLIAGGVVGLMAHQETQRTARLNELLMRQARSLEQVHALLSTQGYLVPPTLPLGTDDELAFRGFESR
jgi:N-acetyl-anhydromuramyl-L-alanine amidase AmpD